MTAEERPLSMPDAPAEDAALAGLLGRWDALPGAQPRFDVLYVQALARQARQHQGRVRAQLHARLETLIAAREARLPAAAEVPPTPPTRRRPAAAEPAAVRPRAARTPLAGLVAQLDELSRPSALPPSADRPSATDEALASLGGPPDLKAMGYFRSTWSRLSAERRLTQSLARVPDQAGPLNAQHLVHQTLAAMRALSPGYLNHFLDYADTLMWLERAQAPRPEGATPARGATGKAAKGGGGKAAARKMITRRSRPR
ncbi:DUF2894 domain-containing protein [Xenophilus arseniciresistens]|uniref:DUF2894 domain-containing protein n=1 Tax=Xenophilus arseniciresistens TaxID=1283306 RepID=A0AAE3N850_9BURK|nr:DUF2894 domain-containing protein [Xenophilus arseniciresistens]MDA7416633.1 DUF2894 domain-containing protein [Xenophilus arseniciresistens]